MNAIVRKSGVAVIVVALMTCFASAASADSYKAKLSGGKEVPPVESKATGGGKIVVKKDMSVSGSFKTQGVKGTAAHIHEGAPDVAGGVVITLAPEGDNKWVVPKGAKFTAAQEDALKAGNLYVNVHSQAHPGGEIRGQLKKASE
jgi:CHRD domain